MLLEEHDVNTKEGQWRQRIRPWRQPHNGLACWQLVSTGLLWAGVWGLTHFLWNWHPIAAGLTLPLHAAIMVRLFVLQHDCSHHSFLVSKRANNWVGFCLGTLFLTPFREWRRSHAIHHATSSCLARRNRGDIYTMTVDEYLSASQLQRLAYRFVRHPTVMLGLGPIAVFVVKHRFKGSLCPNWPTGRRLVELHCTTLAFLAVMIVGCALGGPRMFLVTWGLSFWLAGAVGVFLFYMQHNFDAPYYACDSQDYSFERAALEGASFFDLPRWAHWCTGNIGYHHIHHLDPMIPNYRLPACHRAVFEDVSLRRLGFRAALATLRLKLYDPQSQKMISWAELSR